jgi:hypothetical protein
MTESTGSADSVQVSFCELWEVEVDNDIHGLNIDTSGEDVGAHQASGLSVFEVMENSANKG